MKVKCCVTGVACGWKYIIPSIEYRHKYWYLLEISISWWKKSIMIELCRKDWNKYE